MKIAFFTYWKNCWIPYLTKYFESQGHKVSWYINYSIPLKQLVDHDVAVFCWANEQTIAMSKMKVKLCKKYVVICRSYEIFFGLLPKINFDSIDDMIFVNPVFADSYRDDIEKTKTNVHFIPNAIDLDTWKKQDHKKSFNIGWVANLNHKKGLSLLPQVVKKLVTADNKYIVHIAGKDQEERHTLYVHHLLKDMGLDNNVKFYGSVKNIQDWLKDKDYLLTTSVTEGHPNNVIEAMTLGIKPIIHNWMGAKDTFPPDMVYNTVDEAVNMITENKYESDRYRDFIKDNYDMWKVYPQLEKILTTHP